jgi:hypothetical protein
MKYNDLVTYWGSMTNAAKVLGINNKQTVHNWRDRKRIPSKWQLKAEVLSRGTLKADRKAHADAAELVGYVTGG